MKTLILLRHAKAENYHVDGDKARPLSAKGRSQAQSLAPIFAEFGIEAALVSTAQRTRETFALLGLDVPVTYADEIYLQSHEGLRELISGVDENINTLLLVGHEPAVPELAAELREIATDTDPMPVPRIFATATFAKLMLPTKWAELAK